MAKGKASTQVDIEFRALVGQLSADLRAVTGELEKTRGKVNKSMSGISKSLVAGFSVTAAVYGFKKLGDALGSLAQAGDKAGDIAESFKKLGGASSSIEEAKNKILGAVGAFDLMQIANKGLIKDIPNLNQNFAGLAEYGAKLGQALGVDAKEGIDQVIDALASVKDKQLLAVKLTIDAEKAYKDYGTQLGFTSEMLKDAGKYLTDNEKKLAKQEAVLNKVAEASKNLADLGTGVAQAQEWVGNAIQEATDKMGIGVDKSEELEKAYNALRVEIEKIDWEKLGRDAANAFAIIANAAVTLLPKVTAEIENIIRGLNYLFGSGKQAQSDKTAMKIYDLTEEKKTLEMSPITGRGVEGNARANAERLKQIEIINGKIKSAVGLYKDINKETLDFNANLQPAPKKVEEIAAGAGKVSDRVKEAKKEAQDLGKEFKKIDDQGLENLLKNTIELTKLGFNPGTFEEEIKKLEAATKSGFLKDLQDKNNGQFSNEVLDKYAQTLTDRVVNPYKNDMIEANAEAGEKLREKAEEAAKVFREQSSKNFDRTTGELGGILDKISPELSSAMTDALGQLGDDTKSGFFKTLSETFADGSDQAGAAISEGFASGANILSALLNAKGIDKATSSNQGTGGAIGAGIGSYFGPIGSQIGEAVGSFVGGLIKWGSQNPETNARHAFSNFIEEGFKKLDRISFYDNAGNLKNLNAKTLNFYEGKRDSFNNDWTVGLEKMDDKARTVFDGLGKGIKELLGITEDVGGQVGAMLAANLNGNIDNARLLVYQLGISLEDMTEKLVEVGKTGSMSWHEIEVAIQGATEAYKPGLAAIGDIKGGFNELVSSGGRGMAALKGVKDIAVEALESGAKTFEDFKKKAIESGISPELIDAYINALKQRNIESLEALATASDRTLGGIVADLESSSAILSTKWKDMTTQIDELNTKLNELPTELNSQITLDIKSNIDSQTQAAIDTINSGTGKINLPTSGNLINNTPTVSSPSSGKVSGRVNARGRTSQVVNIDARGAAPGVEQEIRRVMRDMKPEIVSDAVNKVSDLSRRGGR